MSTSTGIHDVAEHPVEPPGQRLQGSAAVVQGGHS
jgi:hypothetical protein